MKFIEDVNIVGTVEDATTPGIRVSFKSSRAKLSDRAEKIISDINYLVKLAQAGKNYKEASVYFPRYQPFIDALSTEFRVKSTSTYSVVQ
jgi:hypothetical protein